MPSLSTSRKTCPEIVPFEPVPLEIETTGADEPDDEGDVVGEEVGDSVGDEVGGTVGSSLISLLGASVTHFFLRFFVGDGADSKGKVGKYDGAVVDG